MNENYSESYEELIRELDQNAGAAKYCCDSAEEFGADEVWSGLMQAKQDA